MQNPASSPAPGLAGTRGARRYSGAQRRYPHSFWWYVKWCFISVQLVLFCVIVVTLCLMKGIYDELGKIAPDVRSITGRNKAGATRVYAADGSVLAEFKGEERAWVPINDLLIKKQFKNNLYRKPGNLINATLSIEDARFYLHPGMDAKRIAGALVANIKHGGASQGGSTITEQLAKNIYLTRTKTLGRRLQTALLALQLERRFSKDEILELYLNEIYYGNRAYGCEAAAQTYFGKHARDLNLAEAAFLAGLPQRPVYLDPFDHYERAKKRQRVVLHEMFQNNKIPGYKVGNRSVTPYQHYVGLLQDNSLEAELKAAKRRVSQRQAQKTVWRSPYFVAYVKQYLLKQYDWSEDYLNRAGLKIYTTIDPKIQGRAEETLRDRLGELGQKRLQGALVCIDPWTGHIIAMVGGRDYYDATLNGEFNRATQARRQPGSTMKPYVYATAMEMGYSPNSTVRDELLRLCGDRECGPGRGGRRTHEVRNYDFQHRGTLTFREAIGMSNNVAATKVLLKVGIENVVQKAHLIGIASPLVAVPSLALGTSEITLLENTSAFGVFATRGLRADPTPIERVDSAVGETLVEHTHPVRGARVLSPEAGNAMWDMLRYVVTSGTGRNAQLRDATVIGKTGTTSSNKDVWFMGATKDLVCGVWMGFDQPKDLGGGSAGGKWCAPVWHDFMKGTLQDWARRQPIEKMIEDARLTEQQKLLAAQLKGKVTVRICDESGLLANAACPSTHVAQFSAASVPAQHCDIHLNQSQPSAPLSEEGGEATGSSGDLDAGIPAGTGASAPPASPPARREERSSGRRDERNTDDSGNDTGNDNGRDVTDDANLRGGGAVDTPTDNVPPPDTGRDNRRGEGVARHSGISYSPGDAGGATDAGDGGVVATVCADSGKLATRRCPVTLQRFFSADAVPRRYCTLHGG